MSHWQRRITPRQQHEITFAEVYRDTFAHGTDGHHRLMLIGQLSQLVEEHSVMMDDTLIRLNECLATLADTEPSTTLTPEQLTAVYFDLRDVVHRLETFLDYRDDPDMVPDPKQEHAHDPA